MTIYTLISFLVTLSIAMAYLNHRYVKIQQTVALMVTALSLSLVLMCLQSLGVTDLVDHIRAMLARIDFHYVLLDGMLSFLLFAGALTIDFNQLKSYRLEIITLAMVSTLLSTAIISVALYYLLCGLSMPMPFLYCLLFGALISPTDPIAVLATFKQLKAPKNLETCIAGEALFNDGIGIILFLTLSQLAAHTTPVTVPFVAGLFLQQTLGGILFGAALGYLTDHCIRKTTDLSMMILLTIGVTTGGYCAALALSVSGPLAMVVSGIFIGNRVRRRSAETRREEMLRSFWEMIDELLNTVLFFLIGLELLILRDVAWHVWLVLAVVPLVLLARLISISVPMRYIARYKQKMPHAIRVLTWGGLRGGLAVALALSLPESPYRNVILMMTYGVVSFSVIVQGLTMNKLIRRAKIAARAASR